MAKKFEYKIFNEKDLKYAGDITNLFVKIGQEGWELVGTMSSASGGGSLYFKREIEPPMTHKQEQNGYDMSR